MVAHYSCPPADPRLDVFVFVLQIRTVGLPPKHSASSWTGTQSFTAARFTSRGSHMGAIMSRRWWQSSLVCTAHVCIRVGNVVDSLLSAPRRNLVLLKQLRHFLFFKTLNSIQPHNVLPSRPTTTRLHSTSPLATEGLDDRLDLKGFLVGNAYTDWYLDFSTNVPFARFHALSSPSQTAGPSRVCYHSEFAATLAFPNQQSPLSPFCICFAMCPSPKTSPKGWALGRGEVCEQIDPLGE